MAAYKSGLDPPTRPGDLAPRSRRLPYTQSPSAVRQEYRELDMAHISGQTGSTSTRRMAPGLPRLNVRDPSRERSESRPRETMGFGFRRTEQPQQELRSKGSRNVLRRKPTSIIRDDQPSQERAPSPVKWTGSGSSSDSRGRPSIERSTKSAEAYTEIFTRPPRTRTPAAKEAIVYPELDRYRSANVRVTTELPHKLATQDLPPPTPLSAGTPVYSGGPNSHHRYSGYSTGYSASPSTRFSESPGPGGGPYSRDTTPTSMSSQSSGIIALKTTTPRLRQGSPALNRPPVTRRRAGSIPNDADPHGLPSLRESITSSSSNSTVKDANTKPKDKKKKKRLSPLPPSPPPRKSSQKSTQKTAGTQESPSKPSTAPAKPVMVSPEPEQKSRNNSVASQTVKSVPPSRPSREGAPDLHSQLGEAMPIIQSNLAGISFSTENRRASTLPLPRPVLVSPIQFGSRQGSRLPSRQPSPTPALTSPREGTPAPSGLGLVPDLRPQVISIPSRATGTRTPSPSTSSKSRFGLFGRRTKTAPEAVPTTEKVLRKGPAAGTGHEGYGRYALRGRSSSAGPGSARERSYSGVSAASSQESIAAHDPFLLERMSPVIIAGGGEILDNGNRHSGERPSIDSKSSVKEVSRTTLWPSALPKEKPKRVSIGSRRPSDSSEEFTAKSSLAFRRSMQRLNSSTSAIHLPRPLKMGGLTAASPSLGSVDSSISSLNTTNTNTLGGYKPKKLEKRAKSPDKSARKWNFFHREKPSSSSSKPSNPSSVQVSVGKVPARAIPHYALLDSSDENADPLEAVDFEDILRDAEVVGLGDEELDAIQFGNAQRMEDLQNFVLPGPEAATQQEAEVITAPEPVLTLQPEQVIFSSPEPMDPPQPEVRVPVKAKGRSRLPQVGRIPAVVPSRPDTTSPKSFSRPFARLSVSHPPPIQPVVVDTASIALGRSPSKPSTPEPIPSQSDEPSQSTTLRQVSSDSKSSGESRERDFLAFSPPRKGSEATTSSSSGGMSFAGTTAVIPEAGAELEEDEVWGEYDDLLPPASATLPPKTLTLPELGDDDGEECEEDEDTMKVPVSATSSHGYPFQYESYESRRIRKSRQVSSNPKAVESPTIKQIPTMAPIIKKPEPKSKPEGLRAPLLDRSALRSSSMYSSAGEMNARVKESLSAVKTPTSPMSFGEFFGGYGERNNSVPGSMQKVQRSSDGSTSSSKSVGGKSKEDPIAQVNLRVGSMTVSKWLTFGHVLFSPARESIASSYGSNQARHHSILVVDGLANDDWSFYAAETYPHSIFYNLSPTAAPTSSNPLSPTYISSPPNHRQIPHASPDTRFPFPSATFDVVVFRFPAAMSGTSYSAIVKEANRVLLPGGYLELAILDLDLRSMGNRGRRAVRALKTSIAAQNPEMHIGSASDVVLKAVGRGGFEGVKSCNVGVPVASPVVVEACVGGGEMSLSELMRDQSSAGDEGITKMVGRVGRWWYSRCYESSLGVDVKRGNNGKGGVFRDQEMLKECEEWNTSFKLCVAFAMKPHSASHPPPSRPSVNSRTHQYTSSA